MRFPNKNRKGFTLIEVIIASAVFTLAAVLASRILVDIVKTEKKTSIENAIYEDARVLMEQIKMAVQQSAIDYDEYYNQYVIQADAAEESRYYGTNFGVYASRFYSPGNLDDGSLGVNPTDLGVICSDPPGDTANCNVVFGDTEDGLTGKNPWNGGDEAGIDITHANAFCDGLAANCDALEAPYPVDELYLINANATQKNVLARRTMANSQGYLGLLSLNGFDLDFNGVTDVFWCSEEHNCEEDNATVANAVGAPFTAHELDDAGIRIANASTTSLVTLEDLDASPFIPVSPLRADLTDLRFYISPIEDPYLGYEEDSSIIHPWVKIVFTLDLAEDYQGEYPGEFDPITLQTTVAAGVVGGIPSYPPVAHIYNPSPIENRWIWDVFDQNFATEVVGF